MNKGYHRDHQRRHARRGDRRGTTAEQPLTEQREAGYAGCTMDGVAERAGTSRAVLSLLGDYFADRESFAALHQDLYVGEQAMAAVLKRAADRREVSGDLPPRVTTLPTSMFRHELFVSRTPPTGRAIAEIVDELFLPLAGVTDRG